MIMAGGDGSLMGLVGRAKEAGVDIDKVFAGVLPFGTGNDLARVLNWGSTENALDIYSSMNKLIREICFKTEVRELNVWHITVKMREGINRHYERFMINYFSFGEGARIGMNFEKNRTKSRFGNTLVYTYFGLWNLFCGCWGCWGCCPTVTDKLDIAVSYKGEEEEVLFTTNKFDRENPRIKGRPVNFAAVNIPSFMGGRSNPWVTAATSAGLINPYESEEEKFDTSFKP